MLYSDIEAFIKSLQEKTILKPLYINKNIVLSIQSDTEQCYLEFTEGQCRVIAATNDNEDTSYLVSIKGNATTLLKLVQGQEKLSTLKQEKLLTVEGKERHILSLESLFILANGGEFLLQNHA